MAPKARPLPLLHVILPPGLGAPALYESGTAQA